MENRKVKKEIVKMLINKDVDAYNDDEIMDLLFENNIAVDVDKKEKESRKVGDLVADKLTKIAGSWAFIILFVLFLLGWILLNVYVFKDLDPYPFILLNLVLSCVAAIQAPIIMMSQNREAKKDSLRNQNDYNTDLKSEILLEELHIEMKEILKNQRKILKYIESNEDKKDSN